MDIKIFDIFRKIIEKHHKRITRRLNDCHSTVTDYNRHVYRFYRIKLTELYEKLLTYKG